MKGCRKDIERTPDHNMYEILDKGFTHLIQDLQETLYPGNERIFRMGKKST